MPSRPTLTRRSGAAFASALAVAAVTHAVTVLIFFAASGAAAGQLQVISDFFVVSSVLLFAFLALAALARMYWRWYTALLAGVLLSVIAALLGTLSVYLRSGSPLVPEVGPSIVGTLGGNNLFFVVVATVAVLTVGRRVWNTVLNRPTANAAASAGRRIALVRQPSANLAEGELTHIARQVVDTELADEQWEAYVAALEAEGFSTVDVESDDLMPDAVFVEDAVVMLGRVAVLASAGAESRRAELAGVAAAVRDLGIPMHRIELPGTLDGGDVLKIARTIYVGRGGRTNAEGIRQFRAIAKAEGYTVVPVPTSKVLHLKSAVTALPDGTVIGYPPLVEHPELFDRFLAVPEESGSAVVVLTDDAVLMAASAPFTAALLTDLGYRVVAVDISEFEKREGCVTCLSVRIR